MSSKAQEQGQEKKVNIEGMTFADLAAFLAKMAKDQPQAELDRVAQELADAGLGVSKAKSISAKAKRINALDDMLAKIAEWNAVNGQTAMDWASRKMAAQAELASYDAWEKDVKDAFAKESGFDKTFDVAITASGIYVDRDAVVARLEKGSKGGPRVRGGNVSYPWANEHTGTKSFIVGKTSDGKPIKRELVFTLVRLDDSVGSKGLWSLESVDPKTGQLYSSKSTKPESVSTILMRVLKIAFDRDVVCHFRDVFFNEKDK